MEERRCDLCGRIPHPYFFSNYVLKVVKFEDKDILPVFCDRDCMIRWISIRNKKPIQEVIKDLELFEEYLREMEDGKNGGKKI